MKLFFEQLTTISSDKYLFTKENVFFGKRFYVEVLGNSLLRTQWMVKTYQLFDVQNGKERKLSQKSEKAVNQRKVTMLRNEKNIVHELFETEKMTLLLVGYYFNVYRTFFQNATKASYKCFAVKVFWKVSKLWLSMNFGQTKHECSSRLSKKSSTRGLAQ